MKKITPICSVPYHVMEVHPNGYVSPCCKFTKEGNDSPYRNNLKFFNSKESKLWREKKFETDKLDSSCKSCDVPDEVYSFRKFHEEVFDFSLKFPKATAENSAIRKLIIGIDNICASSCIECSPRSSTTINNLAKSSKEPDIVNKYYGELPGLLQFDLNTLDGEINDLEVLHLYGGEPLFSPNLEILLNKVKTQSKKLKLISLSTGLSKIKESHVELLANINVDINLSLSIDAPLDLNYWIRDISPDEFLKNLEIIKKYNINILGPQTTIGNYNIFALPEFISFIEELLPNKNYIIQQAVIVWPQELQPNQLPEEIKNLVSKKLENFLETSNCKTQYKEIIKTSLFQLNQPATLPWDRCLERIDLIPKWRGSTLNFKYWLDQYLIKNN